MEREHTDEGVTDAAEAAALSAPAPTFDVIFSDGEALHLPFVGAQLQGIVRLRAGSAAAEGSARLAIAFPAPAEADSPKDEIEIDLSVGPDGELGFSAGVFRPELPRGLHRGMAWLSDSAGRRIGEGRLTMRVLALDDLPLPNGISAVPIRGTLLADVPLVPLGPDATRLLNSESDDVRVEMRQPSEPALPSMNEQDARQMRAMGGVAKRFQRSSYKLNGLWTAVLKGCTVLGQTGQVVSPRGLVGESWRHDHPRVPPDRPLLGFRQPPPLELKEIGDAALWWVGNWDPALLNYYHVHGEDLPALVQLDMFRDLSGVPDFEILLPDLQGWVKEAVELLGIDDRRLRFIGGEYVRPRRLFWPSALLKHNLGIEPLIRQVFRRVRAGALQRLNVLESPAAEFIYIARVDSTIRPMLNEEELIDELRRRGVQIFVARGLSYTQQILAMQNARVIIGPHGAGLTNVGFAPPGALLVEIHPNFYITPLYFRLSAMMGQRYRAFTAAPSNPPEPERPTAWRVDLPGFLEFLDPILDAERRREPTVSPA